MGDKRDGRWQATKPISEISYRVARFFPYLEAQVPTLFYLGKLLYLVYSVPGRTLRDPRHHGRHLPVRVIHQRVAEVFRSVAHCRCHPNRAFQAHYLPR